MPVRRGRKRRRSTIAADGDQRNAVGSSGGGEPTRSSVIGKVAVVVADELVQEEQEEETESAEDYSSMEYWDKRYRDGVFVEWYCGFEHVRPLFERFIPKVRSTYYIYAARRLLSCRIIIIASISYSFCAIIHFAGQN